MKINRLKAEQIVAIQKAAKNTIGTFSEGLEYELLQNIQMIETFNTLINETNQKIESIMEQLNSPILSIPGISTILGSIILAETRNINNFKNPNQLLAFAGLEPSVHQSGQTSSEGRMVKRGSTHLRSALILAARSVSRWSQGFSNYLDKKIAQGKHYNVAVSHLAKKLVRIIFYLLKNKNSFDESKLI